MRDPPEGIEVAGTNPDSDFRLTIIIPTQSGWPAMRRSADAVVTQLAQNRAELIVADASGLPAPAFADGSNVRWLSLPGRSSYALRQAGYRHARAAVIAVTEDHCEPAPDWVATVLEEHERVPEAAGIFGLVENGSRDGAVDWALYSVGYLAWAPPAPARRGAPGHANLSFKAWAFRVLPPMGDQVIEFRFVTALRDAGYLVMGTDRTLVTHFQKAPLATNMKLLFHNGRLIGGLRRAQMDDRDWIRAVAPALIAGYRTARTARLARSKPAIEAQVLRALPFVAVLHFAHAIGESVGYLGGPGQSGRRVH
jgi:Glycosyl transferase family 2